jgi:AraC-like DNA-binding protein
MGYAEFPPDARLAAQVHCLWCYTSAGGAGTERIVPDGRPELIIHGASSYREILGADEGVLQPPVLFAGQLTRPLHLRASGAATVLGVRFRPHGARAFIGRSMRELVDARVAPDFIDAEASGALAGRIGNAASDHARVREAEDFVLRRIETTAVSADGAVAECVALIERRRGEVELDALLELASLGRRQLERRFLDAVGIGPALLAAIFRFRSVFDLLERDAARPWTDAALAAGYYDQSHFIREFRRFVGCTPSEFARSARGLAAALVER